MNPDDKTLEQRNQEFASWGERVYGPGFREALQNLDNETVAESKERFAHYLSGGEPIPAPSSLTKAKVAEDGR